MDNSPNNFTPLPEHVMHPVNAKGSKLLFHAGLNLGAFLVAITVISLVYIGRPARNQATNTKAAGATRKVDCTLKNPMNQGSLKVKGMVPAKQSLLKITPTPTEEEILPGAFTSANSVTFLWKPIIGVKNYYVLLSENSFPIDKDDPYQYGQREPGIQHTFNDLKPNTTYYFYMTTEMTNNDISKVYPTPGNCSFVVPATPVFQFTTNP